ncbi:M56 family metallopeptidase [Flavobacterium urumqiense]|uniref:BlaR1 peptidase M56 n=1 Tax=Flavobacterium urumqiense TaxID=935224 RepID=A0A1H5Z708_9FLAO|nr:M56 family metallopeptidase [Flavobacterium urumqiense]SEG32111.1 BlaR1 peptidase M56 [Flavobacterium urumqiense]
MEAFSIYLIKSSGLIALFYLAYHFMLRKETFFTSNRWFLLLGLFTSIVLPIVVYTKIIWVEPTPVNYDWSSLPINTIVDEDHTEEYFYLGLAIMYCIGTLYLLTKFGFDFYSLNTVLKGKSIQQQADFKFIDTKENVAPFSYFNTIVYNSALYTTSELENIIEHEKVHSEQNHTVDVLISRLFCIVFWFNPFIWWYKKAILQNLEFIADNEATKKISDKKAYQFTLLKITTHENCVAITNHFYQSLIKKRIVMLNKNQSKKWNSWKYALVLPALIAFVLLFQIKTIAQEKVSDKSAKELIKSDEKSVQIYKVNKNTTDEELKEKSSNLKENYAIIATFSGIKRNSKNELTAIKVDLKKGKEMAEKIEIKGNQAIKEFGIIISKNENGMLTANFGTDETIHDQKSAIVSPNAPLTEKETFINGKKASQKDLDTLNSDKIKTIDVKKKDNTISVWDKNKVTDIPDDSKLMISGVNMTELNLEKIDPKNINNLQTSKTTRTIKIIAKKTDGIPDETEIYIDGIKSNKTELDKINPGMIEQMIVNKSTTDKNIIKVITKKEKQ